MHRRSTRKTFKAKGTECFQAQVWRRKPLLARASDKRRMARDEFEDVIWGPFRQGLKHCGKQLDSQ